MSRTDDSLRTSYDSVAAAYVEHLCSELSGKPLDRHLLNRFAEEVRDRGPVGDLGCGPGHVARYLHDQPPLLPLREACLTRGHETLVAIDTVAAEG
ncbi:MAG TPA: hypothetical protein VN851_06840, partial [Thermoanaerobaculia bacterium]|nr:hypothetical protein [Thermoanaerobaculia bacterium]